MGNRFSRRRDVPASSAETEQKNVEEPATSKPAEISAVTQTQVAETENLDVLAGVPVTSVARTPKEDGVTECKEVEIPAVSDPIKDGEPELVVKDPAPVQPELLISAINPPDPEPKPDVEADLAPELAPEPVPEPESASYPEAALKPISEPVPAPAGSLEQHTDLLTQESLPEPMLSSPPLIDLGAPGDISSPAPIPVPLSPHEPSNISAGEQCEENVEAAEDFPLEPEESTETSAFLEEQTKVEAAECLETLGSDVIRGSVSGVLKNLEMSGNDLLNDLIPSDVKIPDDTPITDMSTPIELM